MLGHQIADKEMLIDQRVVLDLTLKQVRAQVVREGGGQKLPLFAR